jgi:hypothetical protein
MPVPWNACQAEESDGVLKGHRLAVARKSAISTERRARWPGALNAPVNMSDHWESAAGGRGSITALHAASVWVCSGSPAPKWLAPNHFRLGCSAKAPVRSGRSRTRAHAEPAAGQPAIRPATTRRTHGSFVLRFTGTGRKVFATANCDHLRFCSWMDATAYFLHTWDEGQR